MNEDLGLEDMYCKEIEEEPFEEGFSWDGIRD